MVKIFLELFQSLSVFSINIFLQIIYLYLILHVSEYAYFLSDISRSSKISVHGVIQFI